MAVDQLSPFLVPPAVAAQIFRLQFYAHVLQNSGIAQGEQRAHCPGYSVRGVLEAVSFSENQKRLSEASKMLHGALKWAVVTCVWGMGVLKNFCSPRCQMS